MSGCQEMRLNGDCEVVSAKQNYNNYYFNYKTGKHYLKKGNRVYWIGVGGNWREVEGLINYEIKYTGKITSRLTIESELPKKGYMEEKLHQDITLIDEGFIVHQVNCRGKMRSGVAGQLRKKYPSIFTEYSRIVREHILNREKNPILGTINVVPVTSKLSVINAFTQYDFGYDGKQYTDYNAIEQAFTKIKLINIENKPVYIPYGMGAGLGGGNWMVVGNIIKKVYPEVIVCRRTEDM